MRSVLFDVDGVLVHGYTGQVARRRRWDEHLFADLGIDPTAFRDLFIKQVFEKEVLTGQKALLSALEETLPKLGFHGSPFIVASYWLNRDGNLIFTITGYRTPSPADGVCSPLCRYQPRTHASVPPLE